MATRTFRRRPRLPVPAMPSGEFQLEPPPEIPRLLPGNVMGSAAARRDDPRLGRVHLHRRVQRRVAGDGLDHPAVDARHDGRRHGRPQDRPQDPDRHRPQGLPALHRAGAPRHRAHPAGAADQPAVVASRPALAVVDRRRPADVGAPSGRSRLQHGAGRRRPAAARAPAPSAADRPDREPRPDRRGRAAPPGAHALAGRRPAGGGEVALVPRGRRARRARRRCAISSAP